MSVALPRGTAQAAMSRLFPQPDPYAADPVGFAADILGFHPWSKQREILESVRDHPRTTVRACHGVGKTAGAAQVALWFLATHPNSRVITTAPTWAQVEQLLWREIRAAVGRAHRAGRGDLFTPPSATKLELGEQWFAIGLSTNEPERFQGHHADDILLIVDEASGVDEDIFQAAEGFLTAEGAKVLLIGNPTKLGGKFHASFTTERDTWNTIHISVFDSPNYTGEPVPAHVARSLPRATWADEKATEWGAESPMYEVRVLGEFPTQASNSVVPLDMAEAAQARDLAPLATTDQNVAVVACDVARYGDDETVIGTRVGPQIRVRKTYRGKPTTETAGEIIRLAREYAPHVRIVIDDAGVGGGVTDILRDAGWRVTAFNGAERAFCPDDYPNRRSELWFDLVDHLPELDLDADEQLIADLTAPVYRIDKHARRVVEPKDDTKRRLGRSPDRGDFVLLCMVPEHSPGAIVGQPAGRRDPLAHDARMSDQDWATRPL